MNSGLGNAKLVCSRRTMGTSRGLRKHSGIARVTVLLIAAVLVVGTAACDGSETYQLTISSTVGGCVTAPGEGVFTYGAGTVVELLATVDDGYRFQGWTGDTQDVADSSSLATDITMSKDHSITANFGPMGPPPGPSIP
jgi:uncharacterized repeat protein (TIGR02543 family)